jgi:HlyD family secretion protein
MSDNQKNITHPLGCTRIIMKKFVLIIVAAMLIGLPTMYFVIDSRATTTQGYEFARVTTGDLENVVTSTGTLKAVGTVEVGSQVSGTVAEILTDFNQPVRRGQVVAVLDTALLAAAVADGEAGVKQAEASYAQAIEDYELDQKLKEKGLISSQVLMTSKTAYKMAEAKLDAARTALVKAEVNLGYAVIRSPIEGFVIHRNVEQGQTVAASLSSPTLFVIAEDLYQMEIHELVDESDIGQIEVGQPVRFNVQAHPDHMFGGTVRQIRMQPEIVSNVVNYTVVIEASNDSGLLLPGMTATVDFIIEQRENILLVPSTALKFTPPAETLEEFRKNMPDSLRQGNRGSVKRAGTQQRSHDARQESSNTGRLWYTDKNGGLMVERVRVGATNGKVTEIVSSQTLTEGMDVITAVIGEAGSSNNTAQSSRQAERVLQRGIK